MARRILSLSHSFLKSPAFLSVSRRHRSSLSGTVTVIDLDSSAPSTSSSVNEEAELLEVSRIENLVSMYNVRQATPDWLPFAPGMSFWVQPINLTPSSNVAEVLIKIGNYSRSKDAANITFSSDDETPKPSLDFYTPEEPKPTPWIDLSLWSLTEDFLRPPAPREEEEEMLSLTSSQGCWPRRNFFAPEEDVLSPVELEEDFKVVAEAENFESEDTEE